MDFHPGAMLMRAPTDAFQARRFAALVGMAPVNSRTVGDCHRPESPTYYQRPMVLLPPQRLKNTNHINARITPTIKRKRERA